MVVIAKITLVVLSLLVLIGGFIGFIKAKSKASLISGVISSALLASCYIYSRTHIRQGLILGDLVCLALLVMFYWRRRKGAKFMPAGLMMILSAIGSAIIALALTIR